MSVSPPPATPFSRQFMLASRHDRDGSVPTTILEAFPAPPTHIPSKPPTPLPGTPHASSFHTNPPPSRPPSLPLPPVPGPSRISEHDLLLLSSANSRPTSRYSTERRDSLVSSGSSSGKSAGSARASVASVVVSPPVTRRLSNGSSSSWSNRSGPPTRYAPRPSIAFSISEETDERLTRLAISPMPLSDDEYGLATSPPTRHHRHNDSISSIDMRDLPAVTDEDEPVVPPFNAFRVLPPSSSPPYDVARTDVKKLNAGPGLTITVPPRASHDLVSLADPIDPHTITLLDPNCQPDDQDGIRPTIPTPPLPSGQSTTLAFGAIHSPALTTLISSSLQPAAPVSPAQLSPGSSSSGESPTKSSTTPLNPQELHREMRAARSRSVSHKQVLRARSTSRGPSAQPSPTAEEPVPPLPSDAAQPRSASPDIDSIMSATPRPARSLRKQPSSSSFSATEFGNRSSASLGPSSSRSRKSSNVSTRDLDADLRNVWGGTEESDGGEGAESGDDSSIDLHTPLPHLMVKHGLLSPHSKLLPHTDLDHRASTPLGPDGRPGSTLSVVTKSGVMKDERNTPMRKERHRDGKMLRGGIGLTTGLGWSDSEDENAPSPLTRRLSSLNLSRRSSATSIRTTGSGRHSSRYHSHSSGTRSVSASVTSHPLSRSYSGGVTRGVEEEFEFDEGEGVDEFGQRVPSAAALSKSLSASSARPRTISSSKTTAKNPGPPTSWHGRPRITTTNSLRPKSRLSPVSNDTPPPTNTRNSNNSDDTLHTPSSTASASSTLSNSLPQTPQDDPTVTLQASISRKTPGVPAGWDKDKILPPLPLQPILKKQPSSSSTKIAFPQSRSRAGSLTNSTPSGIARPVTPGLRSTTPGLVRPLQLPQRYASSSNTGDRPPVPVPSIPHSLRNSASHGGLQPPTSPHPPSLTPSKSVPGFSTRLLSSGGTAMSVPSSPIMGPPPSIPSNAGVKPKPRTGTGMMYKRSTGAPSTGNGAAGMAGIGSAAGMGGMRMRPPVSIGASGVKGVSNGLAMRTRTVKTPGPISIPPSAGGVPTSPVPLTAPRTPTTPVGQAF